MISAASAASAVLKPGTRYVLGIYNGSVSTVAPSFTWTTPSPGGDPIVPQNSATDFTVGTMEFKWLEFTATTEGIDVETSDAAVLWSCTPIIT